MKYKGLIFEYFHPYVILYRKPVEKGNIRMDLQNTLKQYVKQLENRPRTLKGVVSVCRRIMATLYDAYFPEAARHRPGPMSRCPDSDILTLAWLGELVGKDSERAWYNVVKSNLGDLFVYLPERSRFNRRRRNLCVASEKLRKALVAFLPQAEVFIVDSFPMPLCDFKRAHGSQSPLKGADATGTQATYGHAATKGLGHFLGFRGHLMTTCYGLPVDFAIANADIDDREALPLLCERGRYPVVLADKGYTSEALKIDVFENYNVRLYATYRRNQKTQYSRSFQRWHRRIRLRIETTLSQLKEQFQIQRIRARSHCGFRTRLSNKCAAFTLGVFFNAALGRSLMSLRDLVHA